jgi:hypothetical protein
MALEYNLIAGTGVERPAAPSEGLLAAALFRF